MGHPPARWPRVHAVGALTVRRACLRDTRRDSRWVRDLLLAGLRRRWGRSGFRRLRRRRRPDELNATPRCTGLDADALDFCARRPGVEDSIYLLVAEHQARARAAQTTGPSAVEPLQQLFGRDALLFVNGTAAGLASGTGNFCQGGKSIPSPLLITRDAGSGPLERTAADVLGPS